MRGALTKLNINDLIGIDFLAMRQVELAVCAVLIKPENEQIYDNLSQRLYLLSKWPGNVTQTGSDFQLPCTIAIFYTRKALGLLNGEALINHTNRNIKKRKNNRQRRHCAVSILITSMEMSQLARWTLNSVRHLLLACTHDLAWIRRSRAELLFLRSQTL